MGTESIITLVIIAAAVAWAGRGIWRTIRRRQRPAAPGTPPCGPGCGSCPVSAELRESGAPCADAEALRESAPRD